MTKAYIYAIVNKTNNKIYIGKTIQPEIRWAKHKSKVAAGPQKYTFMQIHHAMAKHGINNFDFIILDEFDSEKEAFQNETKYILLLGTNKKQYGYNSNIGGEGGSKPSQEIIDKIKIAANKPENKAKQSQNLKNARKANPELFLKKLKGNSYSTNHEISDKERKRRSEQGFKRVQSQETKDKIAASKLNKPYKRLSEQDVKEIKQEYKKYNGKVVVFIKEIGKRYSMHRKTIQNIIFGITWAHIKID